VLRTLTHRPHAGRARLIPRALSYMARIRCRPCRQRRPAWSDTNDPHPVPEKAASPRTERACATAQCGPRRTRRWQAAWGGNVRTVVLPFQTTAERERSVFPSAEAALILLTSRPPPSRPVGLLNEGVRTPKRRVFSCAYHWSCIPTFDRPQPIDCAWAQGLYAWSCLWRS